MRSCQEIARLVSDGLDRRLPLLTRLGMRMHLMMCGLCARYRRQVLAIRAAVRRLAQAPEADETVRLSSEARLRIQRALDERS